MEKAMDVYLNSDLKDDIKIDSSLKLTNKALEFDDQNFGALNHKATLLFRKKDSKGLIQVVDKQIELTDKPFYLRQKAIYLELHGDSQKAAKYYSSAIAKYQEHLKSDTQNFDLMIEYLGALESSGDTLKADKVLSDMKKMDFKDYQKEILSLYKDQYVSKEQIFKYWKGEIKFYQIGQK
ncbi:MAG: hypothetical protein RI562_10625 [Salibacter sp.]|uniref:tetratricopeptide repeat protein n=1 Tax=Salibacter sp. TaxID=2010995 RepID=UPI0028707981|nr:hypothetical protein [Salibacter sp.]MDR9399506.1 hypothetical protein [Salibacter sp.]